MKIKLWNIGSSIIFSSSIITIISCGTTTGYSDEEIKIQKLINSPEASKHLELLWQKKVLKQLYPAINFSEIEKTPDVLQALKWFIESNIKNNPSYLLELKSSILAKLNDQNVIEDGSTLEKTTIMQNTTKWGFNQTYQTKSWLNTKELNAENNFDSNILKPMAKLLIGDALANNTNFDYLGLKNEIFKTLIVKKYLESKKEEWLQVFKSEDKEAEREKSLTNVEKALNPNKYWVLSKQLITNHFGFYWEVSLDVVKSLDFVRRKGLTFEDADKELQLSLDESLTTVADNMGYLSKKTTSVNKILTGGRENLDKFIGFKGLKTVPSSTGKLRFSLFALKKNKKFFNSQTIATWDGYMQKKELIAPLKDDEEKIKYIQKNKDKVKLVKINVVMPIFDEDKKYLTFNFEKNTNNIEGQSDSKYNSAILSFELFKKNSGIYNNAIKFFTTQIKENTNKDILKRNAIFLEVKNDYARKIWKDKGIKYIK